MLRADSFVLGGARAVAIISPAQHVPAGRSVALVLAKFGERFNGEMQVLPLPEQAPAELPRAILQSANKAWTLTISPERIESAWTRQDEAGDNGLREVSRECSIVFAPFVIEMNFQIARLALTLSRFSHCHSPATELIDCFCNERSKADPLKRSTAFELHNYKAYRPTQTELSFDLNSWVRCKTGTAGPSKSPAVIVEQDLNTLAEPSEPLNFDIANIEGFFAAVPSEADEILQRYFTGENK
jgi:hypothetical protein